VHPETQQVRVRELAKVGLSERHALDPLAGFTLGQLHLRHRNFPEDPSGITQEQYDAGEAWVRLVRRHAEIVGYPLGRPKSPGFVLVASGMSCAPEPDQDVIADVCRRWNDCRMELQASGDRVVRICYAVCIDDVPAQGLGFDDFGNLRLGLNVLARVLVRARKLWKKGVDGAR